MQIGVVSLLSYFLVQFIWRGWDYVQFTRLCITGTKVAHVTTATIGSAHGDYPSSPIQSTLYNWWRDKARRIGNLSGMAEEVHQIARRLEEVANQPGNMNQANINHVMQAAAQINRHLATFSNRLGEVENAIASARIPVSLERFDRWFWRFQLSQVCRVWLLDLVFPFVVGVIAIVLWAR